MTRFASILLIALAAGCASSSNTQKVSQTPPGTKKIAAKTQDAQPAPTPSPQARLLPMTARVVGGREELRFVIIDFTNSRRPRLDERLGVYRVGQKVGEIKISGPFHLDSTVAADIVAGEAKYGDEIKPD